MPRLTDPTKEVAALNQQLARITQAVSDIQELQQHVNRLRVSAKDISSREPSTINNLVFTWSGGTDTMSWNAGLLHDKQGTNLSVSTGSQVLAESTLYWVVWNVTQRRMIFTTSLNTLFANSENYTVCSLKTGNAGNNGSAGGGGTDPGGYGLSGRAYVNF